MVAMMTATADKAIRGGKRGRKPKPYISSWGKSAPVFANARQTGGGKPTARCSVKLTNERPSSDIRK